MLCHTFNYTAWLLWLIRKPGHNLFDVSSLILKWQQESELLSGIFYRHQQDANFRPHTKMYRLGFPVFPWKLWGNDTYFVLQAGVTMTLYCLLSLLDKLEQITKIAYVGQSLPAAIVILILVCWLQSRKCYKSDKVRVDRYKVFETTLRQGHQLCLVSYWQSIWFFFIHDCSWFQRILVNNSTMTMKVH